MSHQTPRPPKNKSHQSCSFSMGSDVRASEAVGCLSPTQGGRVTARVRPPAGGAPLRGGDSGEGVPSAGQGTASRSARLSLKHLQSDRTFCVCWDHTPNYRNDLDKSSQQTTYQQPRLPAGGSEQGLTEQMTSKTFTSERLDVTSQHNLQRRAPTLGTMQYQFDDLGVIPVIVGGR